MASDEWDAAIEWLWLWLQDKDTETVKEGRMLSMLPWDFSA